MSLAMAAYLIGSWSATGLQHLVEEAQCLAMVRRVEIVVTAGSRRQDVGDKRDNTHSDLECMGEVQLQSEA